MIEMRVTNQLNSRALMYPEVRLCKGKLFNEFPVVLPSGKSCNNVFYKTPFTVRGVTGVLVFQVEGTNKMACIFFRNPFIGSNILGLEWRTLDSLETESLEEIATNFNRKVNVSAKTWKTDDIPSNYQLSDDVFIIRATMCGVSKVALEVTILDANPKIDRSLTLTSWMETQHRVNMK